MKYMDIPYPYISMEIYTYIYMYISPKAEVRFKSALHMNTKEILSTTESNICIRNKVWMNRILVLGRQMKGERLLLLVFF